MKRETYFGRSSARMSSNPKALVQMKSTLATRVHPIEIHLHLTSGRKHIFTQSDLAFAGKICDDIDGDIFSKQCLIIESKEEVVAFPGHALMGVTIFTDPLPDSFLKQELLTKTTATQVTQDVFQDRHAHVIAKREGQRSVVLSEVEFANGARLFLEFDQVAAIAIDERSTMHHLFLYPALMCRTAGGYSIWNTAHMVSWSHYPKLHIPVNSWVAEAAPKDPIEDLQNAKFV